MTCKCCCTCGCHKQADIGYGTGIPAYRLQKDMPEAPAGTIFVLVPSKVIGKQSRIEWLTNSWVRGNCQSMGKQQWVAGVIVLPDTAVNTIWFERIINNGEYSFS